MSKYLWVLIIWTGAGAIANTIWFVVRQDHGYFKKYPKKAKSHAYAVSTLWVLLAVLFLSLLSHVILT